MKVLGLLLVALLAVLCLPMLALAQEVAPAPTVEGPWWAQLVYACVVALLTLVVSPYLLRKAQAAKEEAAKLRSEGLKNGLDARRLLIVDLKEFLLDFCLVKSQKSIPQLAADALSKKLTIDQIKAVLKSWGAEAKAAAIAYFKNQGMDIVALVGDAYLDEAIRWAADRTSPFPGKETAVTLATEKYSNLLVNKGVEWVRANWLADAGPRPSEG